VSQIYSVSAELPILATLPVEFRCRSAGLLVISMYCGKTADSIGMSFGMMDLVDERGSTCSRIMGFLGGEWNGAT